MTRSRVGLTLAVALVASSWATRAAAADDGMRRALRLEVGAAGGWSGHGVVAGEGVATLRFGPLVGQITGDLAGPPSDRHPSLLSMLSAGAGLVREAGDWETSATAFLSANTTSYPDLLGTGRTNLTAVGFGLRGGLGRYLGEPGQRRRIVPWLGFSASVASARPTTLRIQDQRQTGFVALVSVTVGAALRLRLR